MANRWFTPEQARTDAKRRFWANVIRGRKNECWLWTAHCNDQGYGYLRVVGRDSRAHRFSYELHKGPIPNGLELDHLCRVKNCVNPNHLEAVTSKENLLRGLPGVNRINAAKTRCSNGHEFDSTSKIKNSKNHRRVCLICQRASAARLRARGKPLFAAPEVKS